MDFYTETGYWALNTSTKVYFQAWSTYDRTDVAEISRASLKYMVDNDFDGESDKGTSNITVINQGISSTHKGKGSFKFYYRPGLIPFLEIPLKNGKTIKQIVKPQYSLYRPMMWPNDLDTEITYSINGDRVRENSEKLSITFQANQLMSADDSYVLQIKLKEKILYSLDLTFSPGKNTSITIDASNFPLSNGGILSANLYKVNKDFIVCYNSA